MEGDEDENKLRELEFMTLVEIPALETVDIVEWHVVNASSKRKFFFLKLAPFVILPGG